MTWPIILCPECGVTLERDGTTAHAQGCSLKVIEHLIGEIADSSHDAEDDNEEPIPAVSPKKDPFEP